MTLFQILTMLLVFMALGGYVTHKYLRQPTTIGLKVSALLASLAAIALNAAGWIDLKTAGHFLDETDFSETILQGALSFLLFAGALHLNLADLKNAKWPVSILATVGTILTIFITGSLVFFVTGLMGLNLPYVHALLFGALISPTDPIAVLALLKQRAVPKNMCAKIGGESLFSGILGIIVFLTTLGIATPKQDLELSLAVMAFVQEVFGGLALGGLLGWIAYMLLKSIDMNRAEANRVAVLLTLALVADGYVLAEVMNVSAPICMVVAGLLIGNHGRAAGISDALRERLGVFWELMDEILSAVLFMLIGLKIIAMPITPQFILIGGVSILAVLTGRLIGVGIPIGGMRGKFEKGTISLLTWGGLRGGLSVAMALSLPAGDAKSLLVPITYIVVLFSVLVQGLSFQRVIGFISKR